MSPLLSPRVNLRSNATRKHYQSCLMCQKWNSAGKLTDAPSILGIKIRDGFICSLCVCVSGEELLPWWPHMVFVLDGVWLAGLLVHHNDGQLLTTCPRSQTNTCSDPHATCIYQLFFTTHHCVSIRMFLILILRANQCLKSIGLHV